MFSKHKAIKYDYLVIMRIQVFASLSPVFLFAEVYRYGLSIPVVYLVII